MPVIKSTADLQQKGFNILVYGAAGSGKTSLIPTLPKPIILSAEGGLISVMQQNLPYIEITNLAVLRDAYAWLRGSKEAAEYASVAVDSLSEIAEIILAADKKAGKELKSFNTMQAYNTMQETVAEIIRQFRDLPKHCYMTAKMERAQDEGMVMLFSPSMPGTKVSNMLAYFFDEVLALRVETNKEGTRQRVLQCQPDGKYTAKDRSGKLEQWETEIDLSKIIAKMSSN